ncbi:hypothetical protein DSO57_1008426 [Entomophthora muscae]|uniref:Uncharacterized protein n=1 Tax=Entomophthora muscae TaxID=34485 RepID=A0ACC2SJZ5_9FUNG|nr:hypothetical protein DSO57_1008426 [Entomophthora muscae]
MGKQMLTSKTLNQLLLKNLKTQFCIVLVCVKDMPLMSKQLNPPNHSPQGPLVGLGVHQFLLSSQLLHSLLGKILSARNDNLDAPKSQNMESESNPGKNPLRTARLMGWERNNPLLIDEVAASPPGLKPLAALQDSESEPPVQDAGNFPEVPTPDTGSLPGRIDKFLPESYSKLPQSLREGTEPKEAPNT